MIYRIGLYLSTWYMMDLIHSLNEMICIFLGIGTILEYVEISHH